MSGQVIGLPQAQGNIRQKMADLQLEVSQPYRIEICSNKIENLFIVNFCFYSIWVQLIFLHRVYINN